MSISTLPDDKLNELLIKCVEKSERYKKFVNEATERNELKLIEINNELKSREEFRSMLHKSKNPKMNLDESKNKMT
jgi:hypothetical protein